VLFRSPAWAAARDGNTNEHSNINSGARSLSFIIFLTCCLRKWENVRSIDVRMFVSACSIDA
jgi:hypothetical protein